MRTASAIAARRAEYDAKDKAILAHIGQARANGAKNARQIANELNSTGVPGPTNPIWTESAVLRCLRRLKARGLDRGSLTPHQARVTRVFRKPGNGTKGIKK
jgi:hypothetical protein